MTKKEMKALSKEFDAFGVQFVKMMAKVEKNTKWADEASKDDDDTAAYILSMRILYFEEDLIRNNIGNGSGYSV